MTPPVDDALVLRLRAGEAQALAEFIEARRRPLLAFIERNLSASLRRKVEPQDILQETAVSALNALAHTDLSQRDPFGWLCQIAEQRIIDLHRKFFGSQKRDAGREEALDAPAGGSGQRLLIDLLIASLTSPSMAVVRDERQRLLMEAMAALPEESRTALRLRYVENLPSKEIAARLGKSDGAVRVLLTRTLSRLQQLLGPDAAP
ncbi:MAG TPA: RNA polymerase subunit sigma [Planctomycetales bacterium]|jgi:RNA polymerase sigma-70 factor (ECF subfamily)|nr:RNA polymerase subunit sigma [Planctomycetales bacterium]